MTESPYEILGVSKTASDDAIRQAYRKLARKYHPDVNPGDTKAETQFKRVASAYEVLNDPERRRAYDEFGEDSLKGGFDPEKARSYQQWKQARNRGAESFGADSFSFDLGDLFGFGASRGRSPMRGQDIRAVVDMDLRQALTGGELRVDVPQKGPLTVRIPPGADTGSTIRLRGKGSPGPGGGPAGDVVIEMRVRPHPLVRRDGNDLFMAVPVTLDEAFNGGTIEVPTFTGTVSVRIPPGSQSGTRLRLRGKGVQRKKANGDFYIEIDIRLPDTQDKALAEAIRNSASAYAKPVRGGLQL